jgi:hypothetical protein
MTTKPLVLAIGTEVALTKYASKTWEGWLTLDTALVVTGASMHGGDVEYSVNGCSWFTRRDLKWIADPTKKSLAFASMLDQDDDDEEDGSDATERKDMKRSVAARKAMKGLKLKHSDGWE